MSPTQNGHPFGAHDGVGLAPAPPRMFVAELPQTCPEPLLQIAAHRLGQPLGGAVLPDDPAGSSLGDPEQRDEPVHGPPASFGAQKFPRDNSLSMSMSNA